MTQDWNPTQYLIGVAISGNRLYTAEDTTFAVYDRSNPKLIDTSHPLGSITFSGARSGGPIALYGNYAYVWVDKSIMVVDVSNPASITQTATLSMPYVAGSMAIQGSTLYALDYMANFAVFSLANPANPTQLYSDRMFSTTAGGLAVSGTSAYGGWGNNLVQLDISNPSSPKVVAQVNVGGSPANLEIVNGYMIGAWGSDGIKMFQVGTATPIGCDYNNPPCTAPLICQANTCINPTPVETGCQFHNPDCVSPQVCQDNVCVTPAPNTGCQYNNPACGTNQTCVSNSCVNNPPVTNPPISISTYAPFIVIGIAAVWYLTKKKKR
jgi:hypothetical protein